MAMLAEPRRKRNYVLTPRGKPLYDDDSRYGSKMLQKMGWTKGKGLGAKESGETDFVRINFKSDAGGLGFEQRDDQWTQHEHGFNGLLESLNAQNTDKKDEQAKGHREGRDDDSADAFQTVGFGFKTEKKKEKEKVKIALSGESLEEKSKKSKARVHYKKFTRGKDLSQYSEKDLANIFGKKTLEIGKHNADTGDNDMKVKENEPLLEKKSSSITDYFKQKMEKRKLLKNHELLIDSAPTNPQQISATYTMDDHKNKHTEDTSFVEEVTQDFDENIKEALEENRNSEEPIRKKRKKDKKKDTSSEKDLHSENLSETYFPVCTEKIKKKRKTFETDRISAGDSNEAQIIKTVTEERLHQCHPTEGNTTSEVSAPQSDLNKIDVILKEFKRLPVKPSLKNNVSVEQRESVIQNEDDTVYKISAYAAEKFRRVNFSKFKGSNLETISGYPFNETMKLIITKSAADEMRILKFWEGSLNKYGSEERTEKKLDNNVPVDENTAQPKKPPKFRKRVNISKQKRWNAFKLGI